MSICCDKLDGAREIIEKDDEIRWSAVQHYYMTPEDKEVAKQVLGFAMVPFYVFVNSQGQIVAMGNKVDFDSVPGAVQEMQEDEQMDEEEVEVAIVTSELAETMEMEPPSTQETIELSQQSDHVFIIDDDF
jgi:hypothetical protein